MALILRTLGVNLPWVSFLPQHKSYIKLKENAMHRFFSLFYNCAQTYEQWPDKCISKMSNKILTFDASL